MVLVELSLIVGLVGFAWAGWKDLKTTEFPDWIPYGLIVFALLARGIVGLMEGSFDLLYISGGVGLLFLGFGLLLYYTKQWGDGDAWLLGAMGFLYPEGLGFFQGSLPFPLLMILHLFLIAFVYIIIYSVVIGLTTKQKQSFWSTFRSQAVKVVAITAVFSVALVGLAAFFGFPAHLNTLLVAFPPLLLFLLVFFHYGKFIEKVVFRRKIRVKDLREGDVPVGKKWRVLGKKELAALKRKGGTIWIKEGVRFAPVFAITVAAMLLFGNILELFV